MVVAVDDEAGNRALLARHLSRQGYELQTFADGESALASIGSLARLPDLILLDVVLPGIDGFEICRRLKTDPLTRLVPIVLLTSLDDVAHKIEGIRAGADDFLSKPIQFAELTARAASLIRLKRYTEDLESAESVIHSLALTVEARDPYTEGHCQRLAIYAVAVGRALGLGADDLATLERGGVLHDVGKIGVTDAVLLKPGRLEPHEFREMQQHTVIGERLCGQMRSLRGVRGIIRHHHERLDGTGYPDGLRGDQIPLAAQIVGVVDTYDAMTTNRPYRRAIGEDIAVAELRRDSAGGRLDTRVVEAFLDLDRAELLRKA
jgi:putative two-component system response regulator